MNEVHGHEVLKMVAASGKAYTRESLAEEIRNQFGPETRFYTCSGANLSAGELVEFLDSKGKFLHTPEGLRGSADLICQN